MVRFNPQLAVSSDGKAHIVTDGPSPRDPAHDEPHGSWIKTPLTDGSTISAYFKTK